MQKKKETIDHSNFRDKFDPTNADFFEMQRQKELKEQQLRQQPSYLTRKFNRIFGGLGQTSSKFLIGFGQGFMVGTVIGIVTGAYVAVRTRRLSFFLVSPIVSGASFGFIMGVGYIIRSAPQIQDNFEPYPDGKEWIVQGGNKWI